jgi:beta-1,4-N-acetylglucosaminyltransferase
VERTAGQIREKSPVLGECAIIFVTVGNHYQGFDRLIRKMDEIAGRIDEKVIMQIGFSKYRPVNADYFGFKENFEEIKQLNRDARVVISHAGVGCILTALDQKTPLILVPRRKKYNEHCDDHQLEIVAEMSDNPNIKAIYEVDELEDWIRQEFTFKEKRANDNRLVNSLKSYLSN